MGWTNPVEDSGVIYLLFCVCLSAQVMNFAKVGHSSRLIRVFTFQLGEPGFESVIQ